MNKVKIKVLGAGCAKCKNLYENTKKALEMKNNVEKYDLEYITDVVKIIEEYGIYNTPAILIDGKEVVSGKVLSPNQIVKLLP